LATAHENSGLPTLIETQGRLAVVRNLAKQLLSADDVAAIEPAMAASFAAAGGNVRETLFSLFDHYEKHRRQAS
jgi:hypothetical protein